MYFEIGLLWQRTDIAAIYCTYLNCDTATSSRYLSTMYTTSERRVQGKIPLKLIAHKEASATLNDLHRYAQHAR